jgi:glutamate-ammonia-ligase adenylyltransferase
MLGWFADEADPDMGLLSFRRVSEGLGTTHWYLKMLRDEGRAAERLAHCLARSRFMADLLVRSPESVAILGESQGLTPRSRDALTTTMRSAVSRRDDAADAAAAVRAIRRLELLRIVIADLVGELDVREVGAALTDLAAATLQVILEVALRAVAEREGTGLGGELLIVGMGSLGGGEMGYPSDADVIFVHRPDPGASEEHVQHQATLVVQEIKKLLKGSGADPGLTVDADLRPEGKNGPLVRSLESYRSYYERWALTWEFQALLRAAPIAGSPELAADFVDLINPLRWPDGGLTPGQVRDIRTLKARMEAERLPRGADPRTHIKLGRGGLTDVEWTVQLAQLQHAHSHPALRVTATLEALEVLEKDGIIPADDARALREAWLLAARLRNAGVLWRGRPVEGIPTDLRDADGVGRIVGQPAGEAAHLGELWRRVTRRSRHAMDFNFYDSAGRGSVIP